ncbi:MAG: hypothetical protein AB7Q76_18915, partial [Gammaproteobacteria bacterium]
MNVRLSSYLRGRARGARDPRGRGAPRTLGGLWALLLWAALAPGAPAQPLSEGLSALDTSSFQRKADAIGVLEASGDPRARPVLEALLGGALFVRKADRRPVIVTGTGDALVLRDAATGDDLGPGRKAELRKIAINNKLRVALRGALARLSLQDPDPAARIASVYALMKDLDATTVGLLRSALDGEPDEAVRGALGTVLALADLSSPDAG